MAESIKWTKVSPGVSIMFRGTLGGSHHPDPEISGMGYSLKIWVGVCSAFLQTLTLSQTKICDFFYPISDLAQNLIPYFICMNI